MSAYGMKNYTEKPYSMGIKEAKDIIEGILNNQPFPKLYLIKAIRQAYERGYNNGANNQMHFFNRQAMEITKKEIAVDRRKSALEDDLDRLARGLARKFTEFLDRAKG